MRIATSTSVSSMRPSWLTSTAVNTPREMNEKNASKMPCVEVEEEKKGDDEKSKEVEVEVEVERGRTNGKLQLGVRLKKSKTLEF